jgi:hypothetical protein
MLTTLEHLRLGRFRSNRVHTLQSDAKSDCSGRSQNRSIEPTNCGREDRQSLHLEGCRIDERVSARGEIELVGSGSQPCCLEVENVATRAAQRRVETEVIVWVGITRVIDGSGNGRGHLGEANSVERCIWRGQVFAIPVTELQFNGHGAAALEYFGCIVQRADAIAAYRVVRVLSIITGSMGRRGSVAHQNVVLAYWYIRSCETGPDLIPVSRKCETTIAWIAAKHVGVKLGGVDAGGQHLTAQIPVFNEPRAEPDVK